MEWVLGVGAVVGMFFLRLVVPAAITLALGYALHRLNAQWHPEAQSET
jgi:hypothetical protein